MRQKKGVRTLDVYLKSFKVGSLTERAAGAMEFKYDTEWLDGENCFPISQSLPLDAKTYRDSRVKFFFGNLLPDSDLIREKMAARVGAESSGDFDVLSAVGKDCVGALQFLPKNSQPPAERKAAGKKISASGIAKILADLPFTPLGNRPESEFRISIAGVQDKTGFLKIGNAWYVPEGTTPCSHIFKAPMGKLPNGIDLSTSIENEWLCLQILNRLGFDTAEAQIQTFKDQKCLIVTRFDRKWNGNTLERLPQEDLCQAMGRSSTKKYQSDGGPGIKEIMDFLMESDYPQKDREIFIRTQIAFFLLGAIDGHAKNFSIFGTKSGFYLTPLYDVLSAYPAWRKKEIRMNEIKLAMSVGINRHYKLFEIRRKHWQQTAKECGISTDAVESIIEDLIQRSETIFSREIKLPKNFPAPIYESITGEFKKAVLKLKKS